MLDLPLLHGIGYDAIALEGEAAIGAPQHMCARRFVISKHHTPGASVLSPLRFRLWCAFVHHSVLEPQSFQLSLATVLQ